MRCRGLRERAGLGGRRWRAERMAFVGMWYGAPEVSVGVMPSWWRRERALREV
jgi:hypothetical protein